MKKLMKKLEAVLEIGGIKKDIILLVIGGISLMISLFWSDLLPFNSGSWLHDKSDQDFS